MRLKRKKKNETARRAGLAAVAAGLMAAIAGVLGRRRAPRRRGDDPWRAVPPRQAAEVRVRVRAVLPRHRRGPPPRLLAGGGREGRAGARRHVHLLRPGAARRARHGGRRLSAERYELPPERLGRWLDRWAEAHGGIATWAVDDTGGS